MNKVVRTSQISAEAVKETSDALKARSAVKKWQKLHLGFDIGTANMVIVALNEKGNVVTAVSRTSRSAVRDGVLVDYIGATRTMAGLFNSMREKLGGGDLEITTAAAAYPPGIDQRTAEACGNVVESLGLDCTALYEEPSAAAVALDLKDGVLVDIGGGTTGISVIENGKVVYTADEPTGGEHMSLVVAGSFKIPFDEAEREKCDPEKQDLIFPVIKPVVEKMATIVGSHLEKTDFLKNGPVLLAGGGASFVGTGKVFSQILDRDVKVASDPMLVTPAGIALSLFREFG